MKLFWIAPALVLAACASTDGEMSAAGSAGARAEAETGIEGLTITFFRCDNGAAFTAQNYRNNSVRVTTRNDRYDLQRRGAGFSAGGVSYVRSGDRATLTGAAGGPYTNCVKG